MQHLAEKMEVAFVMIQHTGKGDKEHAQQQVLGSTGIVATCRSVWGVFSDLDDKDKKIFAPVKMNCGYGPTAISYRILPPDGKVEIIEKSIEDLTADDILRKQRRTYAKKRGPKSNKVGDCAKQIKELLKDGDRSAEEIIALLRLMEFGKSTIQNAKKKAGVIFVRKCRLWRLPPDPSTENSE